MNMRILCNDASAVLRCLGTENEIAPVMLTETVRAIHTSSSVDVLRGHPMGERILARQAELEEEMASIEVGSAEYVAIDTALATLAQYLGADLNHLSQVTTIDLNTWLERNKYLGMTVSASPSH